MLKLKYSGEKFTKNSKSKTKIKIFYSFSVFNNLKLWRDSSVVKKDLFCPWNLAKFLKILPFFRSMSFLAVTKTIHVRTVYVFSLRNDNTLELCERWPLYRGDCYIEVIVIRRWVLYRGDSLHRGNLLHRGDSLHRGDMRGTNLRSPRVCTSKQDCC